MFFSPTNGTPAASRSERVSTSGFLRPEARNSLKTYARLGSLAPHMYIPTTCGLPEIEAQARQRTAYKAREPVATTCVRRPAKYSVSALGRAFDRGTDCLISDKSPSSLVRNRTFIMLAAHQPDSYLASYIVHHEMRRKDNNRQRPK